MQGQSISITLVRNKVSNREKRRENVGAKKTKKPTMATLGRFIGGSVNSINGACSV